MAKKDKRDEHGLTRQERIFADELSLTGNKSASARKAGVKAGQEGVYASRMLRNVMVVQYLAAKKQNISTELATTYEVTKDRVLRELAAIAFLDPAKLYDENGELLPITKMDEMTRRAIGAVDIKELTDNDGALEGYLRKVKTVSKIAALELLGRNLSMWAADKAGGDSILNINIITDRNQLDHPNHGKVIENGSH